MNLRFETGALETYKDFIDELRGAAPRSAEAAKQISGSVRWDGKILGPRPGLRSKDICVESTRGTTASS